MHNIKMELLHNKPRKKQRNTVSIHHPFSEVVKCFADVHNSVLGMKSTHFQFNALYFFFQFCLQTRVLSLFRSLEFSCRCCCFSRLSFDKSLLIYYDNVMYDMLFTDYKHPCMIQTLSIILINYGNLFGHINPKIFINKPLYKKPTIESVSRWQSFASFGHKMIHPKQK